MTYEKKIESAIKLIQSIPQDCPGGVEISYSGGKDSDVILELAKMAGIPYEAARKVGVRRESLRDCVHGDSKTCVGYIWKFKQQ